MKILRSVLISACLVSSTFAIALVASATPTRVVKTDCIWSGNDGKLFKQKCQIQGNSSEGFGTTFRLTWADGIKTVIRAEPRTNQFFTPESKRRVEIYGAFEFDRMGLPRQIHLEGLGIAFITYKNIAVLQSN